jgi:choline dehydrogenase-like flavoprotein
MRRGGYDVEEDRFPKNDEDAELDAYIREHGLSSQHLLSSCRMKKLEDGGVVDFELKVHGIKGLRIADGSVVPEMIASRPQATVVMIAERCAEFIRSGWKDKPFGRMTRY